MPPSSKYLHHSIRITSIIRWIKQVRNNLLMLLDLIKFHCPPHLLKYQIINFLFHLFIYPIIRVLWGRNKANNIYYSFRRFDLLLPLPPPLKSKICLSYEPLIYHEIYLKNIYHQELLKEGMNVIDVGAHLGTYTILAAEKVGESGKVISVEPEFKNYRQLLENIKLNNFKNVISRNMALGKHVGLAKLYIQSCGSGGHSLVFKNSNGPKSFIKVKVKTMDNMVEELGLNKIDVIKIDAEGAEMLVLEGSKKTLKNNPNMKIIVASYHYPSEVKEVCQFLNGRGFKTKVSQDSIVMTI